MVVVEAGGRIVVGVGGRAVVAVPPSPCSLPGVSEGVDGLVDVVGVGGRAVAADAGDPALVVRPVNESEAGAVWNWRTLARPSAEPRTTKGARFIALLHSSECKLLNMNSIGVHPQARKGSGNLISESRGSTEIDVTLGRVWNQASQSISVEVYFLA